MKRGRKKKATCDFDCEHCIYPDCISDSTLTPEHINQLKREELEKKEAEKQERKRVYRQNYYQSKGKVK